MSYKITETPLPGAFVLEPAIYNDDRGYFFESYQKTKFNALGLHDQFVQDNEACSKRGVLRGLHYQIAPEAQSKLVRVIHGSVYDVIADLREESPTFGKWFGIELSAANKLQFYVPEGFAHGYLSLEDGTTLLYKCNNFYSREHEGGIRFDCPKLNIIWPEIDTEYILSSKDLELPTFGSHRK